MIYASILNQHFGNFEYRIPQVASKLADNVIEATIWLHNKVNSVFLPTATKFHYIFNLRDLSNVFQVFETKTHSFFYKSCRYNIYLKYCILGSAFQYWGVSELQCRSNAIVDARMPKSIFR